MKKILALLLLAAMFATMLTMTACDDDAKETVSDNSVSAGTGDGGLGLSASQGTSEGTSNIAPNTSEDNSGNTEIKDDIMGAYTESTHTYENKFVNLGCRLEDEWEVFNREQVAQLVGLTANMINNDALAELLTNGQTVIIFYAQKDSGRTNINIGLEDLGALYGSALNEKQYADIAVTQMGPMLESMGMTGITTKVDTISFAGGEHAAIHVSGSLQGVTLNETAVCIKVGNYMAIITITSTGSPSDCYSMFYGL